jgi:hypothetical protein
LRHLKLSSEVMAWVFPCAASRSVMRAEKRAAHVPGPDRRGGLA